MEILTRALDFLKEIHGISNKEFFFLVVLLLTVVVPLPLLP